jgi:hypothetical protein
MSAYRMKQLDRLTGALGYVCVFWAWLERTLDDLILDLAPLNDLKRTKSQIEQLRDVLLLDTDIRTKIKILRSVAFICSWDDAWFAKLDKILNRIDNDLRPKRNRVVHGHWGVPKKSLERLSKQSKLYRPQSFTKQILATRERVPVKIREIRRLYQKILAAQINLIRLWLDHDAVQKMVDQKVQENVSEQFAKQIYDGISPEALLQLLIAKSSPQAPGPKSDDSRQTNIPPKPKRQRRSSRT